MDVQLTELRTHLHNHRNSRVWSLICTALFHLKKQDKHLNCIWGSTQAILIFIFRVSVLTSSHRPNCLHKLKYLVYTFSYRSFIFLSEMFIRERLFEHRSRVLWYGFPIHWRFSIWFIDIWTFLSWRMKPTSSG